MSARTFHAIGAPAGHRRCTLDDSYLARTGHSSGTVFVCECGRRYDLRRDLIAHHNLEGKLLASLVKP